MSIFGKIGLWLAMAIGTAGLAGAVSANADTCTDLAGLVLPNASIILAAPVTSGSLRDDTRLNDEVKIYKNLPPFCRVRGIATPTPNSSIQFEVWLPLAGWDKRLHMVGNGGYSANIYYAQMVERLKAGDIAVATDTGHRSRDMAFGIGHPEKIKDFAGRAVHESVINAKIISERYYGTAPSYSYFSGCSTGGYQGLMAAQRYPDDFDGIIAGAPGNNRSDLNLVFLWNYLANHRPGEDKAQILQLRDIEFMNREIVKACDGIDGVLDSVINDPRQCRFDLQALKCDKPTTTECLTQEQIATAQKFYDGPHDARTGKAIYPGYPFGTEGVRAGADDPHPGWSGYWSEEEDAHTPDRADFFRGWVFDDPDWNWWKFNWGSDIDTVHAKMEALFDADSTDLRKYQARKGKLIMFMGWADPVGAPPEAINYYEGVSKHSKGRTEEARHADTQAFLHLYMVPGMAHCAGGPGATNFSSATRESMPPVRDAQHDLAIALEDWVEKGRAPHALIATHYEGGVSNPTAPIAFQRPLCVYPKVARYNGGPAEKAESFSCEAMSTARP